VKDLAAHDPAQGKAVAGEGTVASASMGPGLRTASRHAVAKRSLYVRSGAVAAVVMTENSMIG